MLDTNKDDTKEVWLTYSECSLCSAGNRPTMEQHLFYQDFASVFHAQSNHGKAVTDQDDIHACTIGNMGTGKVVGSHDGDGVAFSVLRADGGDGDLFAFLGRGAAHGRVRAIADLAIGLPCT